MIPFKIQDHKVSHEDQKFSKIGGGVWLSAGTPKLKHTDTGSENFLNLDVLLTSLRSKYGMTSPSRCCRKWSGRWG